jgi:hypothetical protein
MRSKERAREDGSGPRRVAICAVVVPLRGLVSANCERAIERQHSWSWQQSFGAWNWSEDAGPVLSVTTELCGAAGP